MSEPFSEEDLEDEVMHNWMNLVKMQFHQLHASGHMNRKQLENLIEKVKPKKIFPIHSENPRLFKELNNNIQTIECVHTIQNFIFRSEHFNMVIELGMGKSSKKKPMTKKEREERKKRRKENRPK